MGKLQYLIIHCSATSRGREVTKQEIEQWHTTPKPDGNGWNRLGYSDMIHWDGTLENLTPYNEDDIIDNDEMTWGCSGKNSVSRHICIVGGQNIKGGIDDTLTVYQFFILWKYIRKFLKFHPNCRIAGHYHFSSKTCPNFDVERILKLMSIPEKNIYRP